MLFLPRSTKTCLACYASPLLHAPYLEKTTDCYPFALQVRVFSPQTSRQGHHRQPRLDAAPARTEMVKCDFHCPGQSCFVLMRSCHRSTPPTHKLAETPNRAQSRSHEKLKGHLVASIFGYWNLRTSGLCFFCLRSAGKS